jgi:diguanylate cyclase (GGDEF)-like protein/PAS domain S-box-containing protein
MIGDVADRRVIAGAAEAERAQRRLAALSDAAGVAILGCGADGRATFRNERWRELIGGSATDAAWQGRVHPDDREAVQTAWLEMLGGDRLACEFRIVGDDESVRCVAAAGGPTPESDGGGPAYLVTVTDLTELRDAQRRLSDAEDTMRESRKADDERLVMHAREQEALTSVATLVASEAHPRAVFAAAAERVAGMLHADYGIVGRVEPSGAARIVGTWSTGDLAPVRLGLTLEPDAQTAIATALRTGQTAAVGGESGPPVTYHTVGASCGLAEPIEVNGRLWGAVSVGWRQVPSADPHAAARLARFAHLVSLAVTGAEAREQLGRLASTDHVTGLYNRRTFSDRLDAEVTRARRHGRPLSLAVFDIDHFKLVNDTHGHQMGDRVLAEFAGCLMDERRDGDIVARVGGEEFAWILPDTDGPGAEAAAERARVAVAEHRFPGVGQLTASVGICCLQDAGDARELFRHADLGLYWSKSNGRNRSFRYSAETLSLLAADDHAGRLEDAKALAAIRALAAAVDAKDPSTQRHSERVAELAATLAGDAGWDPARIGLLRDAALVHDVGKIGVPDQILLKPGRLAPDEYEKVKTHAVLGAQMLVDLLSPEQIDWIRHHHERYDGMGYPDRIAGRDIAEGARILALADAWDAMIVARPYGTPRTVEQALDECRRGAGTHFCPHAVASLLRLAHSSPGVLAPGRAAA